MKILGEEFMMAVDDDYLNILKFITEIELEDRYAKIRELISTPALYEQLAEECTELGKAALKMARIIRGENYTPITLPEAFNNVLEEYTDVYICIQTLGIEPDPEILSKKVYRWIDRNSKGDSDNG